MIGGGESTWPYRCVQAGLSGLTSILWGLEIQGLEHVPREGKVIIAVNHRSWLDPVVAAVSVYPLRFPYFMGKRELFRNPFAGAFLRWAGVIPLERGAADLSAVRSALDVLAKGGCMVLFPEGTRSRAGIPGKPKPGVSFLAQQAAAPVVPARVWNTERFSGLAPMRVRFGEPLRYEGGAARDEYRRFAERVMEEIFRL